MLPFCGRHAGDQGSKRTDWAGLEPPGSLGAPLFNHSAAKQSDGELHMPLVSAVFFCLCLHLSPSASLTFFFFARSPLDASAHLPDSVINLRLQSASPCLHAAALGEFAAQERSWRCKTKIFQKDLIGSRRVAVRHKSDVRSNHYGAGNHMVSGVFRLYCLEEMRLGDAGRQLLADLLKMNSQEACHFKQPFAFYWSSCVEEQIRLWRFSVRISTSAGLNLSWR